MELQELVVRAVTIQLRFALAPRFADVRGALIEELRESHDLDEYGWGETHLQVFNLQRTRSLIVGSRELRIGYEHIERLDDFRAAARSFLGHGLEKLSVSEAVFIGVRTYWLAAVDSFEELREWMVERLSPDEPFTKAVRNDMTDVGWVYEYLGADPQHIVRVGPMKVDQLLEQVFATSERDLFPETFLFVDLDRMYRAAPTPSEQAVERALDSFEKSIEVGEKIGSLLK